MDNALRGSRDNKHKLCLQDWRVKGSKERGKRNVLKTEMPLYTEILTAGSWAVVSMSMRESWRAFFKT